MKKLTTLFLFLALSSRAHAITGAGNVGADFSGVVAFVGENKTCSGVLIANDLILTAKSCFSPVELANPTLVGYFMGSQDGERNPSDPMDNPPKKIRVHESADLALVTLTRGLMMGGSTSGFSRRIYPFEPGTLPGQTVTCLGYGTTGDTSAFQYVNKLSSAPFTVTSAWSGELGIGDPSRIAPYDLGGPCLANLNGELVVAGLMMSSPFGKPYVQSLLEQRGWLADARLFWELAPANNVPGDKIAGSEGASPAMGSKIVLAPPTAGQHQQWELKYVQTYWFDQLYELHVRQSDQCMGVADGSLVEGTRVIQWTCAGETTDPEHPPSTPVADQMWSISYQGNGALQLVNAHSGLCLDGGGDWLTQRKCNSQDNHQRWSLRAQFPADGQTHRLRSYSHCAQPNNSWISPIEAWACDGNDAQAWTMMSMGGTVHMVINKQSGFALDVSGGVSGPAQLLQYWGFGTANQLWRFEWRPGGYSLEPSHTTNTCAATPSLPGAVEIWQNTCADISNQLFWLD